MCAHFSISNSWQREISLLWWVTPWIIRDRWCPLLPRRARLMTVFSEPIVLPKVQNPSKEDVDKWHSVYLEVLEALSSRGGYFLAPPPVVFWWPALVFVYSTDSVHCICVLFVARHLVCAPW